MQVQRVAILLKFLSLINDTSVEPKFCMHHFSKLRCKSQVLLKETKCFSSFGRNFSEVLTPVHVISDGD